MKTAKVIGKKWILEIGGKGFTLWDKEDGRWVINASTLVEDEVFNIGREISMMNDRCFLALYDPKEKPRKSKKK